MEIRDPVHGSIGLSSAELAVLDSAEYQRLRAIKQLGFAEYSFPGATHNRYIHSIGVGHLAGISFDSIFKKFKFSKESVRSRLRQAFRLAAFLHDIGHGPLSHTTEEVMPPVADLKIKAYDLMNEPSGSKGLFTSTQRRANHEDYTIKYVTDSNLSTIMAHEFPDLTPYHVACLIDKNLSCDDEFFIDAGLDFRPILSQLVSSELDVDRMDYLERDSYFCGTNYGKFDLPWLISNLLPHIKDDKVYLSVNRRALYTFDDFLISRHHMYLMVYFHHKSIIFEEMLYNYLTSPDCDFVLPSNIDEYTRFNDYRLYEHLAQSKDPWAQRIAQRRPYKVLFELHNTEESPRPDNIKKVLEQAQIDVIHASSKARLSKYHMTSADEHRSHPIYVVDKYDRHDKPISIDQSTEIFQRYEGTRIINRLYVAPEDFEKAEKILIQKKL
jgi:uncharacterized protein